MSNLNINRAYNYCKILKNKYVKQEIEEKIKGYTLDKIELKNGELISLFRKENGDSIVLTTFSDSVDLTECKANSIGRIVINKDLLLTSKNIEKRKNGIIYSVSQKQFMPSKRFNNEIVLTDLTDQRYVFTKSNLENLLDNFDFNNTKITLFLFKIFKLERNYNLKEICDCYTEFLTHMNYYCSIWDNPRMIKDNIYPSKTYLNGRDISNIYDIDGPDKINRIFDLYRGIINPRNEKDINYINLGFMDPIAYDLMTLDGIRDKEDSLIGTSLKNEDDECIQYLEYLKEMFFKNFGYYGNLELNRDSILAGITYQMPEIERVKRKIEKELGISYSEFEKLDLDEQQKLIDEKKNEQFEENSTSVLSRLLRPFKKR